MPGPRLNAAFYADSVAAFRDRYPIVLTRCTRAARRWIRRQRRGTERAGVVASSSAQRLKPHAVDIRVNINPVHGFLSPPRDTRSSPYLEDAATEFQVQGLELDWTIVTWDADPRWRVSDWSFHSFRGSNWTDVKKPERRQHLKNAYRVLLTRARQGMVMFVPPGAKRDRTRKLEFYEGIYDYLTGMGVEEVRPLVTVIHSPYRRLSMNSQRTFDQLLEDNEGSPPADHGPHKRLPGSVVLEPLGKGIRVTGRDEKHGVLWGFVASKGMLDQPHASIAIYNLLRDHLNPFLESMGLPASRPENVLDAAHAALADMEHLIMQLRDNITVKKASPQTLERAEAVHRAMTDATRMILQEVTFVSLER